MTQPTDDLKNVGTVLEIPPSDQEITDFVDGIIISMQEDFSGERYDNPVKEKLKDVRKHLPEERFEVIWKGDKKALGLIGSPYIIANKTADPLGQKKTVTVGFSLKSNVKFPYHVLGYVEQIHCLIVVRADVYSKP